MTRRPAVRQIDHVRAIRAGQKAGAAQVEVIDPEGKRFVYHLSGHNPPPLSTAPKPPTPEEIVL
jgi:hypothetical protein